MSVKRWLYFSRKFFAYSLVLGALAGCAIFASVSKPLPASAATGINRQVNFQGRLLNSQGATVPDGFYNMQFKIYQDGDGLSVGDTTGSPAGALKWTETYLNNNSQGVQVKNGFLSVQLGSITAFGSSIDWNQDTIWLSMNIGDTNATCTPFSSCTPDGEMVPMKRMSSTPYALNAGQLGGLDSSKFVQIGQGVQGDATNASSIFINKTGTGNLLELQTGGNGAFLLTNAGDATFGANANHTISVATPGAGVAGKSLTVTAGNAGTGAAVNGGDLLLQGGAPSGTGASGSVIVRSNTSNSTTAFQVQNVGSAAVFSVDTSGNIVKVAGAIDTTTATTLTVGAATATAIQIGNTSLSSGTQTITIGTNNTSGGTTNVTIGAGSSATAGATGIQAKDNITFTTNGVTRGTFDTSNNLYLGNGTNAAAPNDFTVSATASSTAGTAGAKLTIQGGAGASTTTGSVGGNVLVAAGNAGGSGNNAGGTITLQGGNKTNTGAAGAVLVKNSADSAAAFSVQSTGSATIFDVDSSNARVGIGTAAPSRQLHMLTNNSTTNGLPLLLEQSGTGDSGLEIKTATKNYFVGVDNSDGQLKFSSPAAANGTTNSGITDETITPGSDSNPDTISCIMFSASSSGTVTSLSAYMRSVNATNPHIRMGLYTNGSTVPVTKLTESSSVTATLGWNTLSVGGAAVTSGTNYWICLHEDGASGFGDTGGGGTMSYMSQLYTNGLPTTFSQTATSTDRVAFYMTIIASGTSDNFAGGSLFTLSDLGQATFRNAVNNTNALRVLNATDAPLLSVDTQTSTINLGSINTSTLATTLNLGTSTGSTQLIRLGATASGTAAAGTLVNIQGGTTASTAVTIGTNGAGGITMDTGTTGGILIGAGTSNNAKTITIGPTATKTSATTIQIGINTAGTETIQLGSASSGNAAAGTTVNIQGGTTANTAVNIGTNGAGGITIDSGTTGNVNIGTGANAKTVTLGSTNTTSKTILQAGSNNLVINVAATDRATFDNANDVYFGNGVTAAAPNNFTISATGGSAAGTAGAKLTIQGGAGASATTGSAGGNLVLSGGSAAGSGNNAGGTITLQGGNKTNTGAAGTVLVKNLADSTTAFQIQNAAASTLFTVDSTNKIASLGSGSTQPVPNFKTPTLTTTGGSIANGTTYYYAITALNGATETEKSPVISYTVSSATNTNQINLSWNQSTGATSYKIYRNTSNSFTSGSLLLTTIGSGSTVTYSDTGSATSSGLPPSTTYTPTLFRADAAANNPFGDGQTSSLGSIYYNTTNGEFQCYKDAGVGGTWADCGVTTLQGAYNNATSTTVPSIKLDTTRSTFNIQDADTTIGTDLLNVRASNSSGLGANMFGVGNTGTVTVQNPTDQNTSLRVLYGSGSYELNVNTATGYFLTNTTQSIANQIQNPGFESGGNITSGEQGWNGPAQASIVNSSANAHGGNYELQVSANTSTLKTYAGTYYEVSQNDVIYFEGWVKNSGGANGTGGIIIEGYDKDKSLIGSASDSGSLPGTSYIFKTASYTVPSNVKYVRVAAVVNSGASTGTYYFDDMYLSSSQRGQQLFQNTTDSTTAFRIQSASASQTLFTADTTNNILKVGDATGTDTATTIFMLDSTTASPTTGLGSRNGGLFFNSNTNNVEAIINGTVVDVCTTAVTCSGYSASAGSTVQLQATTPGSAQTGNFNITGTGILTQLQTQDKSSASTNTSDLTVRTGNATGTTSNSGNLTLDVGTATGTLGTITIGHSNVSTTMAGTLTVQGSNALTLGTASSISGAILFKNSAGSNTITLKAPGSNPTSSWNMVLPQNPGSSGDCLKDSSGTGTLAFSSCSAGATTTLQDTYNNSSSPATITLADGKDFRIVSQDTTTDPNILFNLQCTTSCSTNGRFAVQNSGTDVFTVGPNSTGITLGIYTQVGSSTTDSTQVNFQLDSYNQTTDSGSCTTTTNQGAMYYNTTMGTIRACQNGSWSDLSNPDTLGLISFGIVPSSGSNPYDLPSATTAGVTGPCKVSWASSTSVSIEACVAYSNGKRFNVTATTLTTNSATTNNANLTTTNRWGHVCLKTTDGQPAFTNTAGQANATSGLPTFSITAPILCLADVQGSSTSGGTIDNIYDVRTFTSTLKEAVPASTAVELGMLTDSSGTNGAMVPAVASSQKLYGLVVATDGGTSSTTPNTIVNTVGPGWAKGIAGTAGQFVKTSSTNGYGDTTSAIPNNSFYFSAGNTRTSWSTTCTAASNCSGSMYVNFIVR